MSDTGTFTHRMPGRLLDRVLAYAEAHGISRAAAINALTATSLSLWERANGTQAGAEVRKG